MRDMRFNCPYCEADQVCAMPAWEALGQHEDCTECGETYAYVDSEGGPNPLSAIKTAPEAA